MSGEKKEEPYGKLCEFDIFKDYTREGIEAARKRGEERAREINQKIMKILTGK